VALFLVSRKIEFHTLWDILQKSNKWYLFFAFVSYIISPAVASSRLNSFFKTIRLKLSERYNMKLYWVGLIYNFFLPGGVGGDAYKVYFLKKKYDFSTRKLLSAVFFDRLSGLWALAIFSCALIVFMPRFAIPNIWIISAAFVGTVSYIYILYLFFNPFARRFFQTHFKALVVQGFQLLSALLILHALGHDGKFSPYLLIFLVSSVVAIIPSIGGAIGVRELFSGEAAKYIQMDDQLAMLVSLTFYAITLLTSLPGAYFIFRPRRLGTEYLPSAAEVEKELEDAKTLKERE
jgi:uncharacterized membrane protein YbhN (UPF0104 family)